MLLERKPLLQRNMKRRTRSWPYHEERNSRSSYSAETVEEEKRKKRKLPQNRALGGEEEKIFSEKLFSS